MLLSASNSIRKLYGCPGLLLQLPLDVSKMDNLPPSHPVHIMPSLIYPSSLAAKVSTHFSQNIHYVSSDVATSFPVLPLALQTFQPELSISVTPKLDHFTNLHVWWIVLCTTQRGPVQRLRLVEGKPSRILPMSADTHLTLSLNNIHIMSITSSVVKLEILPWESVALTCFFKCL